MREVYLQAQIDFAESDMVSPLLLMRKYKLSYPFASILCQKLRNWAKAQRMPFKRGYRQKIIPIPEKYAS